MNSAPGRLVAGALSALFCLISTTAADATTNWISTATQAIPLAQATPIGTVNPSSSMRIAVALKMQNAQALANLVGQQNTIGSPYYDTVITPAQFNTTYAPSSSSVTQVTNYLAQSGFSNISVEPNHLFVTATGTAAQVMAAFNTKLNWFSQNGHNVFVNTSAAQVPASLGGIVLSVLGLNNVQATTPHHQVTPCNVTISTNCARFTYDPATYWKTYDVGSVSTGKATSVAVMAEGAVTQTVNDLRTAEAANNLPQVPVKVVQVGIPSPDTAGVTEWDIDTQSSTGMAGIVKTLYIYATTSLSDSDTALEFNHWAEDDLAQAGNASFGICEFFPFLDGTMVAADQVFLEAAAQGQTMFSSTGDTGSSCAVQGTNGVPGSGPPFVSYPAASPYVVGVGGTTLLSNTDGSYNGEVAWYAGGGGISQFEGSPFWQQNIVPSNTANDKGLPDISMDADPNTGFILYSNGAQNCCWGGTSLSSPLSMGVWARLETTYGNKLGFAAPRLYAGYPPVGTAPPASAAGSLTEPVDGFHDILTGANGLYTSLPFYDYTTGMGTFDVSQKKAVIPH